MKKAGIFIIIVGLALTIFTAVTYFTRDKVAQVGNVKLTANKRHHLNWSPLIGVGVMVLGGIVYLVDPKKH